MYGKSVFAVLQIAVYSESNMEAVAYSMCLLKAKDGANLEEISNQKMSAILKQLVDSGVVAKSYEKRKAYFSVVGE